MRTAIKDSLAHVSMGALVPPFEELYSLLLSLKIAQRLSHEGLLFITALLAEFPISFSFA